MRSSKQPKGNRTCTISAFVRAVALINADSFVYFVNHRIFKEVPTYKLVSVSVLIDRMKVNGSIARKAIRSLEKEGLVVIDYQAP